MKIFYFLALIFFSSCNYLNTTTKVDNIKEINKLLDTWHSYATNADTAFFDIIADDGIYIGTAEEEVWNKKEFLQFAKPYFDKGKAWDFKPYDRNIYFNDNNNVAWFNEKLDTWMGVCRGSGILQNSENGWKIYQYTLSMTVPNEKVKDVISVITEDSNIQK